MGPEGERVARVETGITVRYWAAARAAAGIGAETFASPLTLDDLRARILERHPGSDRLPAVLAVCSVLVDGRQPGTPAGEQVLEAGMTVEFLPPFAGG
ncbi:MoaD/ThiS family protein [Nocardioides cavernaquae]|uniref:MoaD/ThiS family protein n=1 Tax=Nocardioides cavernaquae TaxID=2321396 RepID=A0A3A5H3W8_9ACTN|nr:MoaD/ThiS family protein [Nocardioides cavernaquae]RJS45439.1 MoaD/ThiS family protein [Nocardioides cavernaquae]